MYGPAPPRPKKTTIVRSRDGCYQCRVKRKKCDKAKPSCGACFRQGQRCESNAPRLQFRQVDFNSTQDPSGSAPLNLKANAVTKPAAPLHDLGSQSPQDVATDNPASQTNSRSSYSCDTSEVAFDATQNGGNDVLSIPTFGIMGCTSTMSIDTTIGVQSSETSSSCPSIIPTSTPTDLSCSVMAQTEPHNNVQDLTVSEPSFSPNLSLLEFEKLPATRAAETQTFYLNLWETQCIPALQSAFRQSGVLKCLSPVVARSMMALSACQISRRPSPDLNPRRQETGLSLVRPDMRHQALADHYYGSAMQIVRRWRWYEAGFDQNLALTVMLLFCCIESIMGNFQAFELHSTAIERLLTTQVQRIYFNGTDTGPLVAAWLQARLHNWWLKFHFSTPVLHHYGSPVIITPTISAMLPSNSPRATVLHAFCESYRLHFSTIARCWEHSEAAQVKISDAIQWCPEEWGSYSDRIQDSHCFEISERLSVQENLLHDWHTRLPRSSLPISATIAHGIASGEALLQVQPLKFHTHEATMNYAYYVAAKLMHCTGILGTLSYFSPDANIQGPSVNDDHWALLLLRITAGIDWQDCLRFNVHTIGLSGLLLACALQSRQLAIGMWIEKWLEHQGVAEACEEGSFPVLQILRAVRSINNERSSGRDVLAIYHPNDDGGGTGKYSSFDSQKLSTVLVFGKCRSTGTLYSRYIDI